MRKLFPSWGVNVVSEIILNRFKNLFDPNSKFDKKIEEIRREKH